MDTHDGCFTLAYLAGHSDLSITKRYIHPEDETVLSAMRRASVAFRQAEPEVLDSFGPHNFPHSTQKSKTSAI
jgi:hypothetical protein